MFSIITPTFNRAYSLNRVYESLKSQKDKSFHWIVVDDCSTDNTEELIQGYINDTNDFHIDYLRLESNQGKPFAVNKGLEHCKHPYTIIVDSDDRFSENTIQELTSIWKKIETSKKGSEIASVWTLVENEDGNVVGDIFPKSFWQGNLKERYLSKRMPLKGDKWHSWRTSVLKKYGMVCSKNTFVGESATWHRINQEYDFLSINIVHLKCYKSMDGYMNGPKSKDHVAMVNIYTSFFQLQDAKIINIIKYDYYKSLAFEYIKYKIRLGRNEKNLGVIKEILCLFFFIVYAIKRIFKL